MLATIEHRGPDDRGTWHSSDEGVHFGHHRLAILDLSSKGHQPMADETGRVWITYNGEIYNFKEIREELIAKGHRFASDTDTEVVIKAYLEWGMETVSRFRGMFAFALWDTHLKQLFLVRDRAGVKPLYYAHRGKTVVFGSEIRTLMNYPDVATRIDHQAVLHLMQFGYISPPRSVFEDVSAVLPGTYLQFDQDGKLAEQRYWDITEHYLRGIELERSGYFHTHSERDIEEELEELMARGFAYRMVADVPVGLFLSGGIDSSTVAAVLAKKKNIDLRTFTIGFAEKEFNEAIAAKETARALGTEHHELYLDQKTVLDAVEDMPSIYDEPFGDNSGIPTFLVSRMAREHVKVALSADGADELFAGYSRYSVANRYQSYIDRAPGVIGHLSKWMLDIAPPRLIESAYSAVSIGGKRRSAFKDKILKVKRMVAGNNRAQTYEGAVSDWHGDVLDNLLPGTKRSGNPEIARSFSTLKDADFMTQMMCLDFKKYMVDDILVKVDRASMAVSLEAREPFLDHDLVEYVAALPTRFKYRNGDSKYLLKKVLFKYLPEAMFRRPKQGFAAPVGAWLRGPLKNLVQNHLDTQRLKDQGIFEPGLVRNTVDDFYASGNVSSGQIWYLLMFQLWYDKWLT